MHLGVHLAYAWRQKLQSLNQPRSQVFKIAVCELQTEKTLGTRLSVKLHQKSHHKGLDSLQVPLNWVQLCIYNAKITFNWFSFVSFHGLS